MKICFFGSKTRNIKIRDGHFVESSILRPLAFFDGLLRLNSKLNILAAFKHFPFFSPNWRNMTSLKGHFLKSLSTDFSISCERCQLDAEKGTESFLSISVAVFELSRKFSRGAEFPPPPAGRVLNRC